MGAGPLFATCDEPSKDRMSSGPLKKYCGLQMNLVSQLGVAEFSTKTKRLIPARRLDLTQDLPFSLPLYCFNGLLGFPDGSRDG